MVAVKIEDFAGMMPKVDSRRLPPNYAEEAFNVSTGDGRLEAFNQAAELVNLSAELLTIRRIYRFDYQDQDLWVYFDSADVDLVDGPLVNDQYTRKYLTDGSEPKYNTIARIDNGDPFWYLGVGSPAGTFTVTPVTTGTNDDETRAYVLTFVTTYGEEGSPSEPVLATGDPTATWNLASIPTDADANRTIDTIRIYRTITGTETADYYYVGEINNGTTVFVDNFANEDVVRNNILDSWEFEVPPTQLTGLVEHPQGFLAGFFENTIYFSEPYRPHAWPSAYAISFRYEIRGLAVVGNTIVAGTESNPVAITGTRPDEVTVQEYPVAEPCLNRRSLIPFDNEVVYASSNGLVTVNPGGIDNVTYYIMDKHFWQENFEPELINAVRSRRGHYVGLTTATQGFVINPFDQKLAISYVNYDQPITAYQEDKRSGETILVQNNVVFQWDPWYTARTSYDWLSKEFDMPRPINLGYAHIKITDGGPLGNADDEPLGVTYERYNTDRIAYPLDTYNHHVLGASRQYTEVDSPIAQTKQPLGGRVLYNLSGLEGARTTTIQVFVDEKLIYTASVDRDTKFRLPTGYKGTVWQVRLTGNARVYSLALASNGKQLAQV